MSQGKESSASLLRSLRQKVTRSGRSSMPNRRYPENSDAGGGRGRRGRGRGRGVGGGGGGVDLEPPPSASGDVASQLQLELEVETESRDKAESRQEAEAEEEAAPKRLPIRGEAGVPGEDKEPTTEEGKALIRSNGIE